tara:strand:- start:92 stop:346 length:255 start_codon:yes stop_codon:yes gene_type:complete
MNLKRENEILKRLLKDGFFWMNYHSRDCDGCCSYSAKKYTSLQEFYDAEGIEHVMAEGTFGFDLAPMRQDGTYELNEEWSGGSW